MRTLFSSIFAKTTSVEFQIGFWIGYSIIPLIMLVGVIKCFTLLRRPTVCKPCVLAMAFLLLTVLSSVLMGIIPKVLTKTEPWLLILSGFMVLLFLFTTIILAIVGLATFDSTRHTQGRAQAILSLVFAGCLFIGIILVGVGGVIARDRSFNGSVEDAGLPQSMIRLENENCSIVPSSAWTQIRPNKNLPETSFAIRRQSPEAYMILIAETMDAIVENRDLLEVVRTNMANAGQVREESIENITIRGMPFIRRTSYVKNKNSLSEELFYEQWITTRTGYAWQFTGWVAKSHQEILSHDMQEMMETFQILDIDRIAPAGELASNTEKPNLGYRIAFRHGEWKASKHTTNPLVDLAVHRPAESMLIIPLGIDTSPLKLNVVAKALLARLGIPYSNDTWTSKAWPNTLGEGLEFTGKHVFNNAEQNCTARIARNGKRVLLQVGIADEKHGNKYLLERAMDALRLYEQSGEIELPSESQKRQVALLMNDLGVSVLDEAEGWEKGLPWFQSAANLDSKDSTILSNLLDALQKSGQIATAEKLLSERLVSFPESPVLHLRKAILLADQGRFNEGKDTFLKAIDLGLNDESSVLAWLQRLSTANQAQYSLLSAEAWMKKNPGVNSRRWHAQNISLAGDATKALKLLEELSLEYPEDKRVTYDLAEAANDSGDHSRAAKLAEKLAQEDVGNVRALMILGWSQIGRKWYREAKLTFEKAAIQMPNDEGIKAALKRTSALLGQGNNSDIKVPIEVVAIPQAIRKMIAEQSNDPNFGKDQPALILVSARGWRFDRGKSLRGTRLVRLRIQTTQGASDFSTIEQVFDPLNERIHINRLEVWDENGKLSHQADSPNEAYVMDVDDGQGTHHQRLHLQVPGLRPGCVVEYEISTEQKVPDDSFDFQRHLLANAAASVVYITGSSFPEIIPALTNRSKSTIQEIKGQEFRAWIGFEMPIDIPESMCGPIEDRVPNLALSTIEGSWQEVGGRYLKDIQERLIADTDIRALAKKLIQGAEDDKTRISRLARHVQKEISYTAIEFGTRARRPNTSAQILKQKYGDCKDQALLLHLLLQSVGIQSELALVNSYWQIQPKLPSLDQFNHMVVHVPALGDQWLIDPTQKSLNLVGWPADNLWTSHALILSLDKSRLVDPRKQAGIGSSLVESSRNVQIENGSWRVRETLTAHGYYAAWLRRAFTGIVPQQQRQRAQTWLDKYANLRLNEFVFEALDDPEKPAQIKLEYELPQAIQQEGADLRSALPCIWERDYLSTSYIKNRLTPFEIYYPFQMRSEVILEKVPLSLIESVSAHQCQNKGVYTSHRIEASRPSSDSVKLKFHFDTDCGSHPAVDYAAWHQEWSTCLKAWDKPLIWKP
jgi:tetratricopeptide (TPR) repeat protein